MPNRIAKLEKYLDNKLPAAIDEAGLFAGSAGESPSRYSRSPGMWNAAFREIGLDAAYCAFDVRPENLEGFIATVRELPGFMGGNVTVPHKLAIMELLDDVDPVARQIGAVNTYALHEDGRLAGYNTDADGLINSMLRTLPRKSRPFLETLKMSEEQRVTAMVYAIRSVGVLQLDRLSAAIAALKLEDPSMKVRQAAIEAIDAWETP